MGGDADFEHARLLKITYVGCRFSSVGQEGSMSLGLWYILLPAQYAGVVYLSFNLVVVAQNTPRPHYFLSLLLVDTCSLHSIWPAISRPFVHSL